MIIRSGGSEMFSQFQKDEALRIYDEVGSVDQAIHILGYPTRRCLYGWIRERDGKSSPENRRANRSKRNAAQAAINDLNLSSEHILSPQEVDKLQADLHESKMVLDILQEIVRRKQMLPVFNLSPISQREKTEIIDVLRSKYSLHELLEAMEIDRSAYYYHHNAIERSK